MVTSVYLADESDYFREGLRLLLEGREAVRIVGGAADGHALLRDAPRVRPDVIVMDVALPGLNGVEATAQLRAALPAARVILLSMNATTQHLLHALNAGARGYLLKNSAGAELLEAVRAVHAGRRYVSHALAEMLADEYLRHATPLQELPATETAGAAAAAGERFTDRALSTSPQLLEVCRQQLIRDIAEADGPSVVKLAILHGLVLPD